MRDRHGATSARCGVGASCVNRENGTPRAGKSSIVQAIQDGFDGVWMNLGLDSATAAVIITRSQAVLALPGLPDHAALRAGSPVEAAAREMLDGPQTSFLLPAPAESGGYLRVTGLDVPDDAPHHLSSQPPTCGNDRRRR